MNRRQAREKILQVLFQINVNRHHPDDVIATFLGNQDTKDAFIKKMVHGVYDHIEDIDQLIEKNLEHWRFDRIAAVEKTVLRMAFYELLFLKETPIAVVIHESVELAKKYGDEQSGKFINGVLSKLNE